MCHSLDGNSIGYVQDIDHCNVLENKHIWNHSPAHPRGQSVKQCIHIIEGVWHLQQQSIEIGLEQYFDTTSIKNIWQNVLQNMLPVIKYHIPERNK